MTPEQQLERLATIEGTMTLPVAANILMSTDFPAILAAFREQQARIDSLEQRVQANHHNAANNDEQTPEVITSVQPDANVEAVIDMHRFRVAKGVNKYGTTTERTDLSFADWLTHLQEELMDAAVYVERLKKDIATIAREEVIAELERVRNIVRRDDNFSAAQRINDRLAELRKEQQP